MPLSDQIEADIAKVFFNPDDFAKTAKFHKLDGTVIDEILVLPNIKTDLAQIFGDRSQGQYETGTFDLMSEQVIPKMLEKIEYEGIFWTIRLIKSKYDGLVSSCDVSTDERSTF